GIRNRQKEVKKIKKGGILAFVGGLWDSIGGGGWGPVVASNILSKGKSPPQTVGTGNTVAVSVTFFATVVFLSHFVVQIWQVVLGLIVGGVLAARLGAYMAANINRRLLLVLVGLVIVLASSLTLYGTLSQV